MRPSIKIIHGPPHSGSMLSAVQFDGRTRTLLLLLAQRFFLGRVPLNIMASANPTYLKAITVRDLSDMEMIGKDIKGGMILIIRVGPMAQKDVKQLRKLVEELYSITKTEGADIARLGDERIIVTPTNVQIWKPQYDLK